MRQHLVADWHIKGISKFSLEKSFEPSFKHHRWCLKLHLFKSVWMLSVSLKDCNRIWLISRWWKSFWWERQWKTNICFNQSLSREHLKAELNSAVISTAFHSTTTSHATSSHRAWRCTLLEMLCLSAEDLQGRGAGVRFDSLVFLASS